MKHLKYTAKDFAWVKWSAKDIEKQSIDAIADLVIAVDEIVSLPAKERTLHNVLFALEDATAAFQDIGGKVHFLGEVSPSARVRLISTGMEATLTVESRNVLRNKDLYKALKGLSSTVSKLKPEDKRLLADYVRYYERLGFDLDAKNEKRLLANWQKLATLESQFRKNVTDDESSMLVTREELDGMSQSYISSLPKKQGKYMVTLAYPQLVPFLEQATNEKKRCELHLLFVRRGGTKNMGILKRIIAMRAENAKLLGFDTHADYKTSDRMAKTGKVAVDFITEIMERASVGAKDEIKELEKLKKSETGNRAVKILSSDVAHYSDKLSRQKYAIDADAVRQYFPIEHVKAEAFKLYSKLFGVRFVQMRNVALWHKDAELYQVEDLRGNILSYAAIDLYPRPGKYGHAFAADLIMGRQGVGNDEYISPVAALVCNFPKPSKKNPSLLSHNEVETYLHEFGHVMHLIFSTCKNASQSGFHVAWDFVEAPSQMMEHFAWEPSVLRKMTKHHETGKRMPDKMIQNLIDSHRHMSSYAATRQCIYATYDLMMHTGYKGDARKLFETLQKKYTGVEMPKQQLMAAGFTHLMGYDAGYYSYLWARAYAADFYTVFREAGGVSGTVGRKYRKEVLSKGSSRDEKASAEAFLGRKMNKKAFYKDLHLE